MVEHVQKDKRYAPMKTQRTPGQLPLINTPCIAPQLGYGASFTF